MRSPAERLLAVTRTAIAGLCLASVWVLATSSQVKTYDNEVEFAKATREERKAHQAHRCNDRLEDLIQVRLGGPDSGAIARW